MSLFQKFFLENPDFAASPAPVITLLFERAPKGLGIPQRLDEVFPVEAGDATVELEVEADWREDRSLLLRFTAGEHVVEAAGLVNPVPGPVADRCIWSGFWRPDIKELLASHQAHLMLRYTGEAIDTVEKFIFLYKIALVFYSEVLVGVLSEPAWVSHPANILPNLLSEEMLPVVREDPPLLYWTGFVEMEAAGENWWVSRGHHLFNLPDFVLHKELIEDPQAVQEVFHELFHFAYFQQQPLNPGNLVAINEDQAYEIVPLDESLKQLGGPGETHIVHPLTPEEAQEIIENEGLMEEADSGNGKNENSPGPEIDFSNFSNN